MGTMTSSFPARRYCPSCGSRLAHDNTDTLCALCRNNARDAIRHPPTVPPDFWETDQLKEALATWHIGGVIRAYRHHPFHGPSPLAQELVAGWLGMTQSQLSRIEHGRPIKDLDRLIRWAQILRIPRECLWFKLPEQRASMSARCQNREFTADTLHAPLGKQNFGSPELASLLSDLVTDRIPLLDTSLEGARIGVVALDGMSLPKRAELLLKLFLQLDDELGGDVLYPPLSRYVDRLAVNVKEGARDDLAAFGQLAQMAGWLALDANHQAAARRYLTTTIYVAHEVDDPALAANSLAYMSLQETYRARPTSARSLAQTAFGSWQRQDDAAHKDGAWNAPRPSPCGPAPEHRLPAYARSGTSSFRPTWPARRAAVGRLCR
ncbi:MAG: helix-turn-helix domain-containing protein [Egibacteraceae bacterium]